MYSTFMELTQDISENSSQLQYNQCVFLTALAYITRSPPETQSFGSFSVLKVAKKPFRKNIKQILTVVPWGFVSFHTKNLKTKPYKCMSSCYFVKKEETSYCLSEHVLCLNISTKEYVFMFESCDASLSFINLLENQLTNINEYECAK